MYFVLILIIVIRIIKNIILHDIMGFYCVNFVFKINIAINNIVTSFSLLAWFFTVTINSLGYNFALVRCFSIAL